MGLGCPVVELGAYHVLVGPGLGVAVDDTG